MKTILQMTQILSRFVIVCAFFWMFGCSSNFYDPQPITQPVHFLNTVDSKQVQQFLDYLQGLTPARLTSSEGDYYNNLAAKEYLDGNYQKALEYNNQALAFRSGDEFGTAKSYNNMAAIYQAQGEYKKALELYRQSADMLQTLQKTEWYTYAQTNYTKLVASTLAGGRVVVDPSILVSFGRIAGPPQNDPVILFVEY